MIRRALYIALFLALSGSLFAKDKGPTVDVISAQKLGDFWGVELPIEGAESEAYMSSSLYITKDGNPIIAFYYSGNKHTKYTSLYEIAQKKRVQSKKYILEKAKDRVETEQERYIQRNGLIEVKAAPAKLNSNDGDHALFYYPTAEYHWISSIGGGSCRPPMGGTIHVRDLQGKLVAEKTLLYSSLKKVGHHSAPRCVDEGNGADRPRKLSTISLYSSRIWQVDDGTVLAEIANMPYVIRLTPTLTSPFVEQHPDLRFFKAGVLLPVYDEALKKYSQHDLDPSGKDIYEVVDEMMFRFVRQYNKTQAFATSAMP